MCEKEGGEKYGHPFVSLIHILKALQGPPNEPDGILTVLGL